MGHNNEFIEYLLELLHGVGEVRARAMFGGYGLYYYSGFEQGGVMFALIADDVLYLKTDEVNLADFEQRGLEPFSYQRNGKPFSMSYSEAPGEVLDDPDEMVYWAQKGIDAAIRNAAKK
ncbi:MAG: TfoX/Sxy family protein [Gammaproteobacteria bacterium]|nr:TfoX/Sxy family protein [Gammaproteobacteria bacterium]NNJ50228.1 TfoX/Sxy family protein [Gammaproteobacteria bacterium]